MRKRKVLVGVALGSVVLLGGLAVPAQAAAPAEVGAVSTQAKSTVPDAQGWYLYDYYFSKSECNQQGRMGLENGHWRKYDCRNGSWVPWDDYELWVYS